MRKIYLVDMSLLVVVGALAAVLVNKSSNPAETSTTDVTAQEYDRPEMAEHTGNSTAIPDVRSPPE
jgi:hypothetical protein